MIPIKTMARCAVAFISMACLFMMLSLVSSSGTAHASWCSAREDSLEAAPVVFSGKVRQIMRDGGDDIVILDVSQTWRGIVQSQAVIRTGETARDCGIGNCGYKFKVGFSYLVFAYEWPAQPNFDMKGALTVPPGVPTMLVTDICSRTSLLSEAQQDLDRLGDGSLPSAGSGSVDRYYDLVLSIVVALVLTAAGIWLRMKLASL